MGKFIYDSTIKVDFDDRLLAHLQVVIGAKLRRGEAFHFTWRDDEVQHEVERAAASGGWLLVNDGEGARRDAYLWVAAGVPIALVPIPDDAP